MEAMNARGLALAIVGERLFVNICHHIGSDVECDPPMYALPYHLGSPAQS